MPEIMLMFRLNFPVQSAFLIGLFVANGHVVQDNTSLDKQTKQQALFSLWSRRNILCTLIAIGRGAWLPEIT